jgi:hypothetical protein
MTAIDFSAIRSRRPLAEYCRASGFELRRSGRSGQFNCICPLHSEKTPSFTIYPNNRAHCFGCGWQGDVIDLELALRGGTLQEAVVRLDGADIENGKVEVSPNSGSPSKLEKVIRLPDLEQPKEKDLRTLSRKRSIDTAPLRIAVDRCFIWCFDDDRNGRCWVYTDQARRCAIRRRLDNELFCLPNGNETKAAACSGSDMMSPLGYHEAQAYPFISVQEGGPNSLAAIAHAWASSVETRVAPICMPSANANFTAESLNRLQGKRARIFVDDDEPGKIAAGRWAAQLQSANINVDGYSFDGLTQIDGTPVKDLNDLLRVDPDCWETHRETIESVMNFAF